MLEVGETWTYTAAHTVTQAEIDSRGGDLDNMATATGTGAAPDTDDATVTVAQSHGAEHREGRRCGVGGFDRRHHQLHHTVTNTGNATMAGVVVTDDNLTPGVPGDDFNPTFSGGDTDSDGSLDVGETWTYTAAHTVTQAEIDSGGGPGQHGDGDRHRGDLGHRRRDGGGGAEQRR